MVSFQAKLYSFCPRS